MTLKGKAYIDAVVAYLCNMYPTWVRTSSIIRGIGLEVNDNEINNARRTLNHLVDKKLVLREGTHKFKWKAISSLIKWNKSAADEREEMPEELPEEEPKETPEMPLEAPIYPQPVIEASQRKIEALEARVVVLERGTRAQAEVILAYTDKLKAFEDEVGLLRSEVNSTKTIEIKQKGKPTVELEGIIPEIFEKVLALAKCRMNIMLVGPSGCGKTWIAEMVSKALSLQFGAVVCTAGMSESHLLGKELQNLSNGTSKFRGTDFVSCYEDGGVYLWDELDAADPNVLLCVNTALSNGYLMIPARHKKPKAAKHPDFVAVATANTIGRGASRQYSGRNQLDEATLDRFRIGMVECYYDKRVEKALCPDTEILDTLWKIREAIEKNAMRRILSTRFIQNAYEMNQMAGWKTKDILEALFSGWSDDEKRKVGHGPAPATYGYNNNY